MCEDDQLHRPGWAPATPASATAEPEPEWTGPHVVAAAAADLPTPDSLRVVTFNVHYAERMDLVNELLHSSPMLRDADIIVLQEMNEDAAAGTAEALA